ncbi:Probable inactive purple acid phosphatase 27 [Linum grandiflorum]
MDYLFPAMKMFILILMITNIILLVHPPSSSAYSLHPAVAYSLLEHRNHTGISSFGVLNRRSLGQCPDPNPYLNVTVSSKGPTLSDEEFVSVTVSGVLVPSELDWVAMISPSDSDVGACPLKKAEYIQTGDFADLPLLCHYPVKGQFVSNDPDYLGCKNKQCQKSSGTKCRVSTCNGTIKFHVVNFRTDVEFVFFTGGFDAPCVLTRSGALKFANPSQPLYAHASSIDSSGTSMKVTWVSGSEESQQVKYGNGQTAKSQATTFTQHDMCSSLIPSPAKDFGWHDPGYIHSAVLTGLDPSTTSSYKYGSDSVGWSDELMLKTPPASGSDEVKFLAYADMGKAPLDPSVEHFIQPGSLAVVKAMTDEVDSGNVDSIFHLGDISYATGFLVEWDYFLHLISPLASKVPYMTAIGNHDRDYVDSGSVYTTSDSGGECGVPYETYFPMPTSGKDKPWYSIEQASVHFTVISTEHPLADGSEQLEWIKSDMASVDRSKTPWLVFAGHRPMYSSSNPESVDANFVTTVEPLMQQYKVDLALFGHVHNYERTCSVYQGECLAMPTKDSNGVDTYDHSNYTAPVQAVVGTAGYSLDKFSDNHGKWSLRRIAEFGYLRAHATKTEINLEFVNANTLQADDSFRIIKSEN